MCGVARSPVPSTAGARSRLEWVASGAFALLALSCGGPSAAVSAAESARGSPVEVRSGHDYPSLSLVAREGDPFAAIAFAAAHDLGPVASTWLGAVVEERSRRTMAHPFEVRPSENGIVLRARVDGKDQAAKAVAAARDALARPITQAELAAVAARVRSTPMRVHASAADRAVGDCVGELAAPRAPQNPSLAELEKWRTAVFSSQSAAFAAVGKRDMLDATADALRDGPAWPSGGEPDDP